MTIGAAIGLIGAVFVVCWFAYIMWADTQRWKRGNRVEKARAEGIRSGIVMERKRVINQLSGKKLHGPRALVVKHLLADGDDRYLLTKGDE